MNLVLIESLSLLCFLPLTCFTKLPFSTFAEPGCIHVKEKLLLPLILFFYLLQVLQTSFSTLLFMMSYSSLQFSSVSHFCTVMNFADLLTLAFLKLESIISKLNLKNWNLTKIDFQPKWLCFWYLFIQNRIPKLLFEYSPVQCKNIPENIKKKRLNWWY